MRDTILAMTHYTGYFGSLALLWIFMVLRALGLEDPARIVLLLLAVFSILFGLLGLIYVVGLGGVKVASTRG